MIIYGKFFFAIRPGTFIFKWPFASAASRRFLLLIIFMATAPANAATAFAELDESRISRIETFLSAEPAGFGRPIADREFWNSPAILIVTSNAVPAAEMFLTQSFPAWDDDLYMDFSRTGQRPPGEKMLNDRVKWLCPLVVAECVENRGRFLPLIDRVLHEYATEKTWVLPAHDWNGENFAGRKITIDLRSSQFAAALAQSLYFVGDKIDPAVRDEVRAELERRIFQPFRRALSGEEKIEWLGDKKNPVKNNWNAVCLAGVVDAAKILLTSRHDRAVFVAAGEHYSRYFLNGFRADGYCEEGAGYWAYGFGNFVMLREAIAEVTGGRVDLFSHPLIPKIAAYGRKIQMTGGLVPPFEDCRFGTKVDAELVAYCDRVLAAEKIASPPSVSDLNKISVLFMPETHVASGAEFVAPPAEENLRSYFEKTGVLICRPTRSSSNGLSLAIKSGGNGSHSHNDIGSFVLALDGEEIAGDPGGPHAYDDKTFGPLRYTYKLLNSFGHPVPVVAGQLQRDATKVHPKVLRTDFTDARDEIQIDLAPAYEVPDLKSLVRTMDFSRRDAGEVEISDAVKFSRPETFETALETLGSVEKLADGTFEIKLDGEKIRVEVLTPDGFDFTQEKIQELGAPAFTRLGFKLLKPVRRAEVKMIFTPVQN